MRGKIMQTIDRYNDKLHLVRFSITKENEINSKETKTSRRFSASGGSFSREILFVRKDRKEKNPSFAFHVDDLRFFVDDLHA